jgi:hypothetical protein
MEQAPAAMRETKRAARISKDGKWRSFVKFPNLLQYINTQTYYARIKVSGKLIRQSLNTDVWSKYGGVAVAAKRQFLRGWANYSRTSM